MIAQTELSGDAMKTVQEIADYVDGQIHGEGHVELNSVGSLDKATTGALAYAETAHLEQVSTTGRHAFWFLPIKLSLQLSS